MVIAIADPADPRVADYVGMTDAALRRAGEVFLCEGRLVLERAVATGTKLRSVLVSEARRSVVEPMMDGLGVPVFVASRQVLDAVAGFAIHRGIVAAAERPRERAPAELLTTGRTLAVLEGVNDHENLGALFRNAAAFGVDGVALDPTSADPLYRRSVRVSLGHVLTVPFARTAGWPGFLHDAAAAGWTVAALAPDGDTTVDAVAGLDRVCLVLGAEGHGLSADALDAATVRVAVPMAAGVDSLNVATAAAIAFHRRFAA